MFTRLTAAAVHVSLLARKRWKRVKRARSILRAQQWYVAIDVDQTHELCYYPSPSPCNYCGGLSRAKSHIRVWNTT